MKRGIIILSITIALLSLISSEMFFTQPISQAYNLGDSISIPVTIKTNNDISGTFRMAMICNGTETIFYTTGVKLLSGEEINLIDPKLVLIRQIIDGNRGDCKIKAILNSEYILTDSFKISDKLLITGELEKSDFDAGEGILISGKVTKETGENSNGFVEAKILTSDINDPISQTGTITDGDFNFNLSIPSTLKAGPCFLEIKVYEKDSEGVITNNGVAQYNIRINQVPTNLELVFETKEIMPGTPIKLNAILHDQTGEQIESTASLTIKDSKDKIIEQKEINMADSFELPTSPTQVPEEWTISATSENLFAEEKIKIKTNQEADIQIINKTIIVTNIGNVFYNKTVLVRVGDSPVNIQVELEVGESKKYVIKAPNGDYNVKISEGNKEITELMSLTGKAIEVKETSKGSWAVLFWIALILILGTTVVVFSKRLYKKPFFGKMFKNKNSKIKQMEVGKDFKMVQKAGTKAELSLSMKEGEKQEANIVCIKIKDLKQMRKSKSRVSETIQRITDLAENNNAVIYENQDYLFFILTPSRTKALRNEKTALDLAEKIKSVLEEHNRMFNQKINFGISLNYGTIIGKQEGDTFKFVSLDSVITNSRKIASLSEKDILLSNKINDLLRLNTKTEKEMRGETPVFVIKAIKKETDEATKNFINRFMERQKKKD